MPNKKKFILQSSIDDLYLERMMERLYGEPPFKITESDYNKKLPPFLFNLFGTPKFAALSGCLFDPATPGSVDCMDFDFEADDISANKIFFQKGNEKFWIKLYTYKDNCSIEVCGYDLPVLMEFVNSLKSYKIKEEDSKIGVLYQSPHSGILVKKIKLEEVKVDIELNYGSHFKAIHEKVVHKLNNVRSGLYIFMGAPGCGKTTYIKHLTKLVPDRLFIFVPTNQLEALITPQLLPVLMNHKNAVLILEDAEKAVISRENLDSNQSLVSTILNLTDGILSSLLNISLIVTFNTKREEIDKALLRKGRLLIEHKFDELSVKDSIHLLESLGKRDEKVTKPMSLADIYYLADDNYHQEEEKRSIGFGN